MQVRRHDASVKEQMMCAEDALDAQKRRCGSGEYICDGCLSARTLIEAVEIFKDVPTPPKIVTLLSELLRSA